MKPTITIRNIGPIKDVTLELDKVNVIIGSQSSGKSTIAKIISYCQWVEKRYILDGDHNHDFTERFIEFHRVSDVAFNEESFIEYKSDCAHIKYDGIAHIKSLEKVDNGAKYIKSKNIYIPAERNFVSAIRNLRKYKGSSHDNIMNFVYDWSEVRDNYLVSNKFPVLGLNVSYYYNQDSDSDMLTLEDSNGLEIPLGFASSGLQSITPILLPVDYMTSGLYKSKIVDSVDEKEEMAKAMFEYIKQLDDKRQNDIIEGINEDKSLKLTSKEFEKFFSLYQNRKEYQHSQFIIEEPEQNLFPQTQRDLIYYLLEKVNDKKRDHKLLITTHSPYVLYALNNCMMGHLVKDKMPEEEQTELLSKNSWIDPEKVSVWQIKKGEIISIKDKETKVVGNHYFNEVMGEIMDEYYEMLNYFE